MCACTPLSEAPLKEQELFEKAENARPPGGIATASLVTAKSNALVPELGVLRPVWRTARCQSRGQSQCPGSAHFFQPISVGPCEDHHGNRSRLDSPGQWEEGARELTFLEHLPRDWFPGAFKTMEYKHEKVSLLFIFKKLPACICPIQFLSIHPSPQKAVYSRGLW